MCLDRLTQLSGQVDRLTSRTREERIKQVRSSVGLGCTVSQVRSRSLVDIRHLVAMGDTGGDIDTGVETQQVKTRTCHQCHCPLNEPYHAGTLAGVDHCTLAHWDGCLGGRTGAGRDSSWKACPVQVQEKTEESFPTSVQAAAAMMEKSRLEMLEPVDKNSHGLSDSDSSDDDDDEELRIRQEELEQLKRDMVKFGKDKRKAEKREQRRLMLEKVEKERMELLSQARAMRDRHSVPSASALSAPLSSATTPVQQTQKLSANRASKALKEKAAEHAARQRQLGADRAATAGVTGLTMPGIRSLPGMTPEVEEYLNTLQGVVPSLAKPPSVPIAPGLSFQPPGVLGHQHTQAQGQEYDDDVDPGYVFVAKLGKLVKVVPPSPPRLGSAGHGNKSVMLHSPQVPDSGDDDDETSEDEDCPLRPETGYRFIWKRDSKGRKYFVSELVRQKLVESSPRYVFDQATGRTYREEVGNCQVRNKAHVKERKSLTRSTPKMTFVDHRQVAGAQGTASSSTSFQPSTDERMPTFLASENERQGRENKVPELLQWARNCPVSWTNKITSDKLNVVLFTWSYVSELLAARTGRAPDLALGELEARLQHLLHVLEVTLQTSSQTDYSGDSWKVARLYHTKVQQKVDSSQASWVQLTNMHHNATLPHELMAAMQELASKPKPKVVDTRTGGKGEDGKGLRRDKKICSSWNRAETRGKCTYEIEHPGEKCKYMHECSWCKYKGLKPVDHQRFFCKKRLEAEED